MNNHVPRNHISYHRRFRSSVARWLLILGLVTVVLAPKRSLAAAPTQMEQHVPVPATGLHTLRPRGQSPSTSAGGQLAYQGGDVQWAPAVYVDFWGWSSDPQGESTYLQRFLSGVGASAWSATVTQYCADMSIGAAGCDSGSLFAGNPAALLQGLWWDPATIPSQPGASDITAEAQRAAAHFGSAASQPDVQVVVATPTGHSTPGFGSSFCAYHGFVGTAVGDITYTNLPYIPDAGWACGAGSVNGSAGVLDGVSIVEGHELAETESDPTINAWLDSSGQEIGDKCAWVGLTNVALATGTFPVQPLWSNAAGGCVTSFAGPPPGPPTRIAVIDGSSHHCLVKSGGLFSGYTDVFPGVGQPGGVTLCLVAGARIAVISSTDHHLYLKDGSLGEQMVDEYPGVGAKGAALSAAISGQRICVLAESRHFLCKDLGLYGPYTDEYPGLGQRGATLMGSVTDDRVGVLTDSHVYLTKFGGLAAGYVQEYPAPGQPGNVTAGYLYGTRIGVIAGNSLLVKQGDAYAPYVNEWPGDGKPGGILAGGLSDDGIAVLDQTTHHCLIKSGVNLYAPWVDVWGGQGASAQASSCDVSDSRIGVLDAASHQFMVKTGSAYGQWILEWPGQGIAGSATAGAID